MPVPPAYQCGAIKKNGEPCRGWAWANGRCRHHGGGSRPGGPTHQSWKHGRLSKYRDYPGIEFNPQIESLREVLDMTLDIQVMYGRIDFLIKQQIEEPDVHDNWPFIRSLLMDLKSMKVVAARIREKEEKQIAESQIEAMFERVGIAAQRIIKDEATRNKLIMEIIEIVQDCTQDTVDTRIEQAIEDSRELESAAAESAD